MSVKYIAVNSNHWGLGDTKDEAVKNLCKLSRGGLIPDIFGAELFEVNEETTVDGMGHFTWPQDLPGPKKLATITVRKSSGKWVKVHA